MGRTRQQLESLEDVYIGSQMCQRYPGSALNYPDRYQFTAFFINLVKRLLTLLYNTYIMLHSEQVNNGQAEKRVSSLP